ncbi:AAA family ATPase [Rubritalea tangerina]|uniref:AAA family ATPase n=1 Tax=Rubritalea tangerina TaxID=430798 RepID=UPI0036128551
MISCFHENSLHSVPKGGSGKTTLAINLAVASQLKGKSAMIADMDSQQSSSMWHTARADDFPYVQATDSKGLKQLHAAAEEQGFDHFFIDTAPTSNKDSLEAVEIADVIAVTCKPSIMDLRAISNTIDLIEMAKLKDKCKAFMVLSMVEQQHTRPRRIGSATKRAKNESLPSMVRHQSCLQTLTNRRRGGPGIRAKRKPQKKSPLFTNS